MANKGKIVRSYSIAEFKELTDVRTIKVLHGPNGPFMAANNVEGSLGAVARKYDATQPKQVVEILDGDTTVFVLCNQGTSEYQVTEEL